MASSAASSPSRAARTVTVVAGQDALSEVTLDATPRWVGLGPLQDAGGEFVLQAGTGAAEIGGLRRGEPGALLWPWDQGLEAEFVRDIRYQSRSVIKEPFQTAAEFNVRGRCMSIMDDHGLTLLLRIAPASGGAAGR